VKEMMGRVRELREQELKVSAAVMGRGVLNVEDKGANEVVHEFLFHLLAHSEVSTSILLKSPFRPF
jgi:hypothetical protein